MAKSENMHRLHRACAAALLSLLLCNMAWGQPQVLVDSPNDAVIRRTDSANNGPIDPSSQRLPDIAEMRLGRYAPKNPASSLFSGDWDTNGGFMRFDLVLSGLINPPGPLGYSDTNPIYNPLFYGPNPIYGYIEFDMDSDEDTGGELASPYYRYLGNVARFGGLPHEPRFINRAAEDYTAFDHDITTPPYVDRSGEEFHLVFLGEDIEHISIRTEKPGGNPNIFEAGETWDVTARAFHRSHGWESFLFQCWEDNGRYKPELKIRYAHNVATDRTTISFVYPLTNAADASTSGPNTPVEPNDGCVDNQNSILEALTDLQFSAFNADPWSPYDPDFQLLANWADKDPTTYLAPETWRITAIVGTAYAVEPPDGAHYIWTDVWPNPRPGDFNGDCQLDSADTAKLNAYITAHDGQVNFDDDGSPGNGIIQLHYFAGGCCLYDTDYNGIVSAADRIVGGDMNLNQSLEPADVADFVQAMLDPVAYATTHGGQSGVMRGDLNCDGLLDGLDIQIFVSLLLNP